MARSDYSKDRLLSPETEVRFAGFSASAAQLQACGWEFSVREHAWSQAFEVALYHPRLNLAARYNVSALDVARGADPWRRGDNLIRADAMQMADPQRMLIDDGPVFRRFDAYPSLERFETQAQLKTLSEFGVFRKWQPETKEIIVEPATVQSLMDEILKLQSKDLAEIRERTRTREWREAQKNETVAAQIIAVSA